MHGNMEISTARVPATSADGRKVLVERQTVTHHRQGQAPEVVLHYRFDHSHVGVEDDGSLVVLSTGERLTLGPPEH